MPTPTPIEPHDFIAELCRCESRFVLLVEGPTWPELRKRCQRNLYHTGWHTWVEDPAVEGGRPLVVLWNDDGEELRFDTERTYP